MHQIEHAKIIGISRLSESLAGFSCVKTVCFGVLITIKFIWIKKLG